MRLSMLMHHLIIVTVKYGKLVLEIVQQRMTKNLLSNHRTILKQFMNG